VEGRCWRDEWQSVRPFHLSGAALNLEGRSRRHHISTRRWVVAYADCVRIGDSILARSVDGVDVACKYVSIISASTIYQRKVGAVTWIRWVVPPSVQS
jgi:hypothetical protein